MWKRCKEINYVTAIPRHYSSLCHQLLTPAPHVRDYKEEVAKLIDVTTCIGCKACQVACSEWNDIRDKIGTNVGVYDNPTDLTAKSWTVMRFSEVEENGKLEWLIRKDGCMHCADPGCLKRALRKVLSFNTLTVLLISNQNTVLVVVIVLLVVLLTCLALMKKITVLTNVRYVLTVLKLAKSLRV